MNNDKSHKRGRAREKELKPPLTRDDFLRHLKKVSRRLAEKLTERRAPTSS